MRHLTSMLAVFFGLLMLAVGAARADSQVTAFVDVTVVPMDQERAVPHQTVIVRDGLISAVASPIDLPKGAHVVNAGGLFLSPGLADMHTHSKTSGDLKVYLANGVTSILNMGGATAGFMDSTRPAANEGRIPGPHVYAAFMIDGSPQFNNFFVSTPEEARAMVRIAKTNGYEFMKVYNDLSPACFQALIDEGRVQHVPVIGHGLSALGLRRQLDAGQLMVAHTEEFLYTVFFDPNHIPDDGAPSASQIPGAIEFVLRDHAFVTADLATYAAIAKQWGKKGVAAELLRDSKAAYLRPEDRLLWAREEYATRKGSSDSRLAFLQVFTKAMSDAGVPLILGTDAPSIGGLVPGFSVHDDLDALQAAGLSRFQALSTATRTAGEFVARALPAAERFGVVAPGYRADLLLTAENPLVNLATLRTPLGVMARGKWYEASSLKATLDALAQEYASASVH